MTDEKPTLPTSAEVDAARNYEASHNLNQFSSPGREIYMHNTSTERHHANMMAIVDGLPKDNPVGIMALLEVQISRAMEAVFEAQKKFKHSSERLQFHWEIDKDHYEDVTEGLQETSALIEQLQHELDDYIPDSVFPTHLITPSAEAYDEGVAKDFFAHIFDSYEGEEGYFEFEKLVLLQANLRDAYESRQGWLDWDKKKQVHDINNKAIEKWLKDYKETQASLAEAYAKFLYLLSQRTGAIENAEPAKIRAENRIRVQSGKEAEVFNDTAELLKKVGAETREFNEQVQLAQANAEEAMAETIESEQEILEKIAVKNAALEKATRDPLLDVQYRRAVREKIEQEAAKNPTYKRNYDRSLYEFANNWPDFYKRTRPATIKLQRRQHVKNNFALRGGILVSSNVVRVIPIQRENENGNTILCMLPEYDNTLVILAIDMNSKYKWFITTVFNQYAEWTAPAENQTEGVPTNVTDDEDETAENCLVYHDLIWKRIEPLVNERLALHAPSSHIDAGD